MNAAAIERCRERIASLASAALADARDERALVALLGSVWATVDEALALGRAADAPAPACRAGCSTCCRINVGTLGVEGAVVAARVRAILPAPEARDLAARLLTFHDRVRWLEDRERTADGLACPFLEEDASCAIHPVRPLACRSVSSLDPAECRRALSGAGGDDDDAPALVRMDLLQRALHVEALAALAEVFAARGLDARCRDVSGMAAVFLADPALAGAWLAGARLPLA